MFDDRYDSDPVSRMKARRGPVQRREVVLAPGLVVEHTESEWCGAVTDVREGLVHLEDFHGKIRAFPLRDAFLIDGEPVALTVPKQAPASRARTASGSFAVEQQRARVAMPSRIFVEGKHDAQLVEQVWGDDLRVEGVVVELLEGADNLEEVLRDFGPGADRRAGILLDHLIDGSKESRIADTITRAPYGAHVLITGHPYVDIWQAVKPARVGLETWPTIPRSIEWKRGICHALGLPWETPADIASAWAKIRGRVRDFRDLEPALVGRVEHLIDFVTA